jgi:hypothetical protein
MARRRPPRRVAPAIQRPLASASGSVATVRAFLVHIWWHCARIAPLRRRRTAAGPRATATRRPCSIRARAAAPTLPPVRRARSIEADVLLGFLDRCRPRRRFDCTVSALMATREGGLPVAAVPSVVLRLLDSYDTRGGDGAWKSVSDACSLLLGVGTAYSSVGGLLRWSATARAVAGSAVGGFGGQGGNWVGGEGGCRCEGGAREGGLGGLGVGEGGGQAVVWGMFWGWVREGFMRSAVLVLGMKKLGAN